MDIIASDASKYRPKFHVLDTTRVSYFYLLYATKHILFCVYAEIHVDRVIYRIICISHLGFYIFAMHPRIRANLSYQLAWCDVCLAIHLHVLIVLTTHLLYIYAFQKFAMHKPTGVNHRCCCSIQL